MCGISGFYHSKDSLLSKHSFYEAILTDMQKKLRHRGPDDNGIYLSAHCGLAHTRLSIIDLIGGHQPMTIADSGANFTICYNGELYNTADLRCELSSYGQNCTTTSDTEVILRCFLHYGPDFVTKLNGIFAFAILDEAHDTLYLYRDSFGIKPLFYTQLGDTLIFSSEMKGLLCYPGVEAVLDSDGLNELLGLGPARTPGCGVLQGFYECLPGHYLICDDSHLRSRCYYRLTSRPHTDSYEQTLEKVSCLVTNAIKRQMVSDVPICTFLSGGLDSSLVSAICAEELKKKGETLSTFSFDFIDNDRYFTASAFQPSQDRPYVDLMVHHIGSNHHYLTCDNHTQADLLRESVAAHDLPCMADIDSSLLYFCGEVSHTHKVVLTGECADEVFGGYPWFHREEFLSCGTFPWTPDLTMRTELIQPKILQTLHLEEYVADSYETSIHEIAILPQDSPTEVNRRRISYLNIRYFMQTLLNRMDRTSMHSGLEARVPFADRDLIDYVFNIPWEMKAKDGLVKNLLRQTSIPYLPDEITFRKKSPYPKTYHPYYEELLGNRLKEVIITSPILEFIDLPALLTFLDNPKDYGKPWYGQLMAGPQMIAYLLQLHYWITDYQVQLKL